MSDPETLDIHPATPDRWDDLATLFERPGPRGGRPDTANCWCVIWRAPSGEPEENREVLRSAVCDREEPGLLAYAEGVPIGWISVAPREHFQSLLRSRRFAPPDDDAGVFVITCFAIARTHRRRGVSGALLDAAIDRAIARGASAIEAFPSDPPDYKGGVDWFLDRGFEPVREIGKRIHVRLTPRETG